jgi:hypothetical protein
MAKHDDDAGISTDVSEPEGANDIPRPGFVYLFGRIV